ncbi:MAG: hypothetical protein AAFP82_15550, partial [Bacteroidota bacterium]
EDADTDLEFIVCSTLHEFQQEINDQDKKDFIKAWVVDLSNLPEEEDSKTYRIAQFIRDSFDNNRIPIFIHSANLQHYDELEDKGTVFKIAKGNNSIDEIGNKILQMQESGFLNIFCHGGILDQKIMEELHSAFVNQFKGNEIEEIIKSVKETNPEDLVSRTTNLFERIAIRSLYQNVINPKETEEGTTIEIKVNPIEHYYRRTEGFKYWTGDIFQHKTNGELVIIITPRCNVGHCNYDELMLCKIIQLSEANLNEFLSTRKNKGWETYRKSITDDVTHALIGERKRFLPVTPQFVGGFVDYKTCFSLKNEAFDENYQYLISLVDDMTNDVIRKFSSYFLRAGISETEYDEAYYYVQSKSVDNTN